LVLGVLVHLASAIDAATASTCSSCHLNHFFLRLVDVSEIRVLLIRQVIEPMGIVDLLAKLTVLFLVAEREVESQERNDEEQGRVASKVDGERLEVARIIVEEDLGTNCVTRAPCDEVHCDADRLFSLPSHITREHTHSETLCSPEGEDDPVADKQTGSGRIIGVLYSHDHDSADESAGIC
jgi:hypothetical protein